MSYAFAYDIRTVQAEPEMPRPRRCRRGFPDLLAAALLHRWDAGARDVPVALSVVGGSCDVRKRCDGDCARADLARPARASARRAPAGRAGLRMRGDPGRGV